MIPRFLLDIAAQVRALVASGKAMHVTEQTATELERIAAMHWDDQSAITLSDFAWAWLKLSRTCYVEGVYDLANATEEQIQRAAECAELAVIAGNICPNEAECPRIDEAYFVCAHQGAREGAVAAWSVLVAQCDAVLTPLMEAARRKGKAGICHGLVKFRNRYSGELAALSATQNEETSK